MTLERTTAGISKAEVTICGKRRLVFSMLRICFNPSRTGVGWYLGVCHTAIDELHTMNHNGA